MEKAFDMTNAFNMTNAFLELLTAISFLCIMAMVVLLIFFKAVIASTLFFWLILGLSVTAALGLLIVAWFLSGTGDIPLFSKHTLSTQYLFTCSFILLTLLLGCFTAGVLTANPVFFIISLSFFAFMALVLILDTAYNFIFAFEFIRDPLKVLTILSLLLPCACIAAFVIVNLSLIGIAIPTTIVFIASALVLGSLLVPPVVILRYINDIIFDKYLYSDVSYNYGLYRESPVLQQNLFDLFKAGFLFPMEIPFLVSEGFELTVNSSST